MAKNLTSGDGDIAGNKNGEKFMSRAQLRRGALLAAVSLLGVATMGNCSPIVAAPVAQPPDDGMTAVAVENADQAPPQTPESRLDIWNKAVNILAPGVLLFSILIFLGIFVVMLKSGRYWDDASFKAFGLTLIINAGLFLIVVGWSDEQLAPMMGLLGTIAGYILGSRTTSGSSPSPAPQPPHNVTPVG